MAWTAPRTWVTGEVVTASQMNTHIRDNLLAIYPRRCEVYRAGTATVATATYTTVSFDSETIDTSAFHDIVTNNSRITIPAGLGGTYRIHAKSGLLDGAYAMAVRILINGAVTCAGPGGSLQALRVLTVGQYVEFQEYQASGGNVSSLGGTDSPTLGVELVELT